MDLVLFIFLRGKQHFKYWQKSDEVRKQPYASTKDQLNVAEGFGILAIQVRKIRTLEKADTFLENSF